MDASRASYLTALAKKKLRATVCPRNSNAAEEYVVPTALTAVPHLLSTPVVHDLHESPSAQNQHHA